MRFKLPPPAGGQDVTVFDARGRTALVLSTASRSRAGALNVGQRVARPRRGTVRSGSAALKRRGRFVYGVANGRVRWVATGSRSEVRNRTRLRGDLRAAGVG